MARLTDARTRVEDIHRRLKDDICFGRLVPGSRFNLDEYSKANGVSLTVVREAATRLASEHLMVLSPQLGFRIWPLSIPHLLDLTRVRTEIERLTLQDSIANGDLAWEAALVAAHHSLAGVAPGDRSAWLEAHSAFHATLAEACSSPLLKQLRQQLFDSAELYRHWSANAEPPKRRRPITKEHRTLLNAALARDVDAVVAQTVQHIERTTSFLVASQSQPAAAI
jgi:DNA-binding GntR family transcriptional regulator